MVDVGQEPLYADIPKVILDPRDDVTLLSQMYMRVLNASDGQLNKATAGSALAALFEGIVYALATQRWYINNLPEAIAIEMFRFSGIRRSAGQFATGEVTVLLNNGLGGDFLMSAGTFIPAQFAAQQTLGQGIGYTTQADLRIPAGAIEGTVAVKATTLGASLNAIPYQVVVPGAQLGLPYVNTVHNRAAITGGADVEDMVTYIKRVQADLRSNGTLVTTLDFENAVVALAGGSAYAKAIPLMDANRTTPVMGNVAVFFLFNDYTVPSVTNCGDIRTQLLQQTLAGSYVHVYPMDVKPIQIDAVITVQQWSDDILTTVNDALAQYMAVGAFAPGGTLLIDELRYVIRGCSGVLGVTTVDIEGQGVNLAMPNQWTVPQLSYLYLTMVDQYGNANTLYTGIAPTIGVAQIVD